MPKTFCGAKTKSREGTCRNAAGFKTDHVGYGNCHLHGGATRTHQRHAQELAARAECATLGIPIEVDPGEALILELWETAGNVAFYRALIQQLPSHPDPDVFVRVEPEAADDGEAHEPFGHWERGEPGIYGRTYHVSGAPTGEAKPHILVSLYNDERKHLTDVAAAALRAGVEERRVRMAEADATKILEAQVDALIAIGLADRLEDFRGAFINALRPVITQPAALGAAGPG